MFAHTKCPLCPRLFGISLTQLCSEEEPVPKAVQELLLHLFRYGPNTTGIFRKSANARIAKEIKIELDEGKLRPFIVALGLAVLIDQKRYTIRVQEWYTIKGRRDVHHKGQNKYTVGQLMLIAFHKCSYSLSGLE